MICKISYSAGCLPIGHYLQTVLQIWWCPFPVYNSRRPELDLCSLKLLRPKAELAGSLLQAHRQQHRVLFFLASSCNLTFSWLNCVRFFSVPVDLLEPEKRSTQLALFIRVCISNAKASGSGSFSRYPCFCSRDRWIPQAQMSGIWL